MTIKYRYHSKFDPRKLAPDNIDRLSTAHVPPNSKVLELGCATGFMGRYFTRVLGCRVVGVEIDPQAAQIARRHLGHVIAGSLDDDKTYLALATHAPFDVVFASAIIEHLQFPDKLLAQSYKLLKPGGLLIITFPNIAHWRMRLALLRGIWQYQDYGLLDKTHLKFFTFFTAQELIKSHRFHLDSIELDPAGGIKFINLVAKFFPNFYAHQLVISAHKP